MYWSFTRFQNRKVRKDGMGFPRETLKGSLNRYPSPGGPVAGEGTEYACAHSVILEHSGTCEQVYQDLFPWGRYPVPATPPPLSRRQEMKWNQPLFYDECPVNCIMERAFTSPAEQTSGERETEWEFSELLLSAGTRSPVRGDVQEPALPQLEHPTRHS